MSKATKFPKFTTQRRVAITADAMERNLTVQELWLKYQEELKGYDVDGADTLRELLYQRSNSLAKDLNKFIGKKSKVQAIMNDKSEKTAAARNQLTQFISHYKGMGFDLMARTEEYSSISSRKQDSASLDDILSLLGDDSDSE